MKKNLLRNYDAVARERRNNDAQRLVRYYYQLTYKVMEAHAQIPHKTVNSIFCSVTVNNRSAILWGS